MTTDTQGNALSGASADAAALYDGALHAFNLFRGDPVALLDEALALAPEFAMASIAKAHLLVTSSEPAAISEAGVLLDLARKLPLNEREAAHVGALETLLRGEWSGAALALDRLSLRYPHDILALQSGHLLDFYCADSRNLRDRIARVLPL